MKQNLLNCDISRDEDIVWVRNKARQISEYLGFSREDQTRISTAVSEIARNAFQYARGGRASFALSAGKGVRLDIVIQDQGPGILQLEEIENGLYKSPRGMGIGLTGARRLMDAFDIETGPPGTRISMSKRVEQRDQLLSVAELNELLRLLSQPHEQGSLEDLKRQNEDIINALVELNNRREELVRLNKELEETNKGVVALYAELDEKAHSLKLASESKTAFLSNLTHEFRSPLNSILGISRMLMEDARAEHAAERMKQVNFIMEAAQSLSELVNDLLDIAKIEAGKVQVRITSFSSGDILTTIRGLMRPMAQSAGLELNFLPAEDVEMVTDEGKLAQILRNLISNALKYTEQGHVTVSVRRENDGKVCFSVADTGIGIAKDKQEAIFDEFIQVENPLQEKIKGTGLGLPLSRRLARILGGDITVESEPGRGSVFHASLKQRYQEQGGGQPESRPVQATVPKEDLRGLSLLVVDDQEPERLRLVHGLQDTGAQIHSAASVDEGLRMAQEERPDLIILDLVMPGKTGVAFINESLDYPFLREVPIILHTSKVLEAEEREFLAQSVARIIAKEGSLLSLKKGIAEVMGTPLGI